MKVRYESKLNNWKGHERYAVELSALVGRLSIAKKVELVLFRKKLFDLNHSAILAQHYELSKAIGKEITPKLSAEIARAIDTLEIKEAKIDIARLAVDWLSNGNGSEDLKSFVAGRLNNLDTNPLIDEPQDVVLFGFGRIGRIVARILTSRLSSGQNLRLRAIVSRRNSSEQDIIKRASLLRKDSVHGRFNGTISEDGDAGTITVNGQIIHMIESSNPAEIDYEAYGIHNALMIDNTGLFRTKEALGEHLKAKGISRVLLTAPGKGDIPNVVFGINENDLNLERDNIISAASCTTNAICPPLQILQDKIGIEKGHLQTVHAYTNDQNLLDNYHKKYRRGRSAPLNLVITETGAASAVAKVIPELGGLLTANAVRVPTPNVSLAIMNIQLKRAVTEEELGELFLQHSTDSELMEQIEYSTSNELVSNDVVGNIHTAVIDGKATILSEDRKSVVLYVWYDNEYGYTEQVIRLSKYICGAFRKRYL